MIFNDAKALLTMPEVAANYGFSPNRAGFIRCPFHAEKTASLKLYDKSFYCFGCGTGGSVIDFVSRLYNLSPLDAVKRLNEDFSLGLDLDRAPTLDELRQRRRTAETRELFDKWKAGFLNMLDACIRTANLANLDNLTDAETAAICYKETFEYWADILMHGTAEQQMTVFRDREGVKGLCKTILRLSPKKSNVA